ncbi:hypothetical protein BCL69_11292 [Nitrosomonas communis]|uniref:Uncharacterized protein n=1 Tax=Nitrosomonas communis TaxID=44574 RepID=A0A5D3Y974_9PROT|nr:hypothetical protein BCL69_11292 [Nitrosomonas communis]
MIHEGRSGIKRQLGCSVEQIMETIEAHINQFFMQALQLDYLTLPYLTLPCSKKLWIGVISEILFDFELRNLSNKTNIHFSIGLFYIENCKLRLLSSLN